MQILLNKGDVKVKATKPELKKLYDAKALVEAIPAGLGFDYELKATASAMGDLLNILDPPSDAPEE